MTVSTTFRLILKWRLLFFAIILLAIIYLRRNFLHQNVIPNSTKMHLKFSLNSTDFQLARKGIKMENIHPIVDRKRLEKRFKNPCWFEKDERTDLYASNPYHIFADATKMFAQLQQTWVSRLHSESRNPRRFRCMPYFFLIGMPKCGTTDLYGKLSSHPEIEPGALKEPNWFAMRRFGILHHYVVPPALPATLSHYFDLFDSAASKILTAPSKIVGEASPTLMFDNEGWLNFLEWRLADGPPPLPPMIASHLALLNPDARLIAILRNPATRLFSEYKYFPFDEQKSPDHFHDYVVAAMERFESCLKSSPLEACVYAPELMTAERGAQYTPGRLRIGIYHVFIREWLLRFPRKRILILRLEDYAVDRDAVLEEARRFLGLEASFGDVVEELKTIENRAFLDIGPMKEETAELLRRFYAPHNQKLAKLLRNKKFLWQGNDVLRN